MHKSKLNPVAIACSLALSQEANGRIQLTPFGWFKPQDGREEQFYVGDENGYQLAEDINSSGVELMIDYEHQTIFIAQNGNGNPAAGWIKKAEYISGSGLFADVRWTAKAASEIKEGIYRYISPLFLVDENGVVVKIINAALTNRPALHNLAEAMAMSSQFSKFLTQKEDKNPMKELLIKLFALSAQATDEQITEKLNALIAAKGDSQVALSDVYAKLNDANNQVVTLNAKVNNPDPSQFVALSQLQAVQTEFNNFKQQIETEKRDAMIAVALSDGRLLPAQKAWAENLGKTNLQALSEYLNTTAPNPALNGTQSGGQDPNQGKPVALSDAELAAAKALGLTAEQYIDSYKEAGK